MSEAVHTHRQSQAIINRLARIEGHVRKVKTMVEEGRDCSDVLIQLAAVRSAVNKTAQAVLEDHVESCLLAGDGNTTAVWTELKEAFDIFF
jgi:CsoR family transcriptional regulator, copper-sensing transcriptional repressor